MKTVSAAYQAKEEEGKRKPVELYHFWYGATHWRYTSGDADIVYGTDTYHQGTIARGSVVYDSNMEASSLQIDVARLTDPAIQYIASNPVEVLWVEVLRVFRDMVPLEVGVIFIGQVKSASIKGLSASVECVGFEFFLKQPIPKDRYQQQCNYTVFDSRCAKSSVGFTVTTAVTVSANGLELTSGDFALKADKWYQLGYIVFGDHKRMITEHVGNVITIRHKIVGLVTGNTITAYAGCDGFGKTCFEKFNNILEFGGDMYIPIDNPVTWISG